MNHFINSKSDKNYVAVICISEIDKIHLGARYFSDDIKPTYVIEFLVS
jgi:hypothetical protein